MNKYICIICGKKGYSFVSFAATDTDSQKIVCRECNKAMAYFNNDPELLRKAATYLEKL